MPSLPFVNISKTAPYPGLKTNCIPKIHQNGEDFTLSQTLWEQQLGADHPGGAQRLNNLAALY